MASAVLDDKQDTKGLPNYVVMGNGRVNSVDTFAFGSAYLGSHTHPYRISADPTCRISRWMMCRWTAR